MTFSVCACAGVLIFSLLLDFDFELRNRNCAIDQKQQMGKKISAQMNRRNFFLWFLESFYLPKVVLIHFHQIHKISLFPDTCEKFTSLVLHNFTFVSSFEIEIEWSIVIVRAKTFHKTCADKKLQVNLHIYAYEPIFQPSCLNFFEN